MKALRSFVSNGTNTVVANQIVQNIRLGRITAIIMLMIVIMIPQVSGEAVGWTKPLTYAILTPNHVDTPHKCVTRKASSYYNVL